MTEVITACIWAFVAILALAAIGSFIDWLKYGNETPEQRKARLEREREMENNRDYDDKGFWQ